MKIWKSDLQGLLEEIPPSSPLYVGASVEHRGGEIPMSMFYVSVAGFNEFGHCCELRILRQDVPSAFTGELKKEREANLKTLDEIKARLDALGRSYRDGTISDTPVGGTL
jgi:hypothetical protein